MPLCLRGEFACGLTHRGGLSSVAETVSKRQDHYTRGRWLILRIIGNPVKAIRISRLDQRDSAKPCNRGRGTDDGSDEDSRHWSRVAGDWVAWARKPNHDAFWAYQAALVAFIGRGSGTALDVGCGEGRVARVLTGCGYQVTAVDPVFEFVDAAAQAGSAQNYAVGTAAGLPFADARFDLRHGLQRFDGRCGRSGSRAGDPSRDASHRKLIVSIGHPFARHFDDTQRMRRFVVHGSYFGRQRFDGVEERDGMRMHFAGWSQPLEAYAAASEAARSQSYRCANRCPNPVTGGTTSRAGAVFRCSSG